MKKLYILIGILILASGFEIKADLLGDRSSTPTYIRALRVARPRTIVVKPPPSPPQLSQEQRAQEQTVQRQLTEQEIETIQARMEKKAQEARVAGLSFMYGASEYGYHDHYIR